MIDSSEAIPINKKEKWELITNFYLILGFGFYSHKVRGKETLASKFKWIADR